MSEPTPDTPRPRKRVSRRRKVLIGLLVVFGLWTIVAVTLPTGHVHGAVDDPPDAPVSHSQHAPG